MADQNNQEKGSKLLYWVIGLFTGGAVVAPITAFVCKNIFDKKVAEATDKAETAGINAGIAYALQQQEEEKNNKPNECESKPAEKEEDPPMKEEDYAEKDPREYNVGIDDEEPDPEQEELTYLDMTTEYLGDETTRPRMISEEDFLHDHRFEKFYINWYTEDNVFEEELQKIPNPQEYFGVTNGADLFRHSDKWEDPNVCYIRNDKTNISADFAITRVYGSYKKIVGGEQPLGETNS